MAVCPRPQHRGGVQPSSGSFANYLADERESRERVVLMDGHGRDITAAEATELLGGPEAAYWDGLACPSENECEELTREAGGDQERAARLGGERIAEQLGRSTKGERPLVAIHWDSLEPPKWHYHLVGRGEPRVILYGEHGAIQRAWDTTWDERERPRIRDWDAHKRFQSFKLEGDQVRKELRALQKERPLALRGLRGAERDAARTAFDARERTLIDRRFGLEVAAIDARYAARDASGSAAHRAELERAGNRQKLGHARIDRRERGIEASREAAARGRALTAANRQARRAASALGKVAEALSRKSAPGREIEADQRRAEEMVGQVLGLAMGRKADAPKPLASATNAIAQAAPQGSEDLIRAATKTIQTAIQALAEGSWLRAASAATLSLPKVKSQSVSIEVDR